MEKKISFLNRSLLILLFSGTVVALALASNTAWSADYSDKQLKAMFEKRLRIPFEKKYNAEFQKGGLEIAIQYSQKLFPHLKKTDALFRFLEAYINETRLELTEERQNNELNLTENHLRNFGEAKIAQREQREQLIKSLDAGRAAIKKRVFHQDHVVDALVDAWQEVVATPLPKKTKSVMILGTTGTGKSYAAEVLADVFMTGHPERILKLEGSDFGKDISETKMVGAPPGYISSDKYRGQIPEFLAKNKNVPVIIIINEFEKMHPDVTTRLMELLERGQISAGDGKLERPGRCLLVLTSNRGVNRIINAETLIASEEELMRKIASYSQADLKRFFTESFGNESGDKSKSKPELVNRIDYWVAANILPRAAVTKIVHAEAKILSNAFFTEQGVRIEISDNAIDWLVGEYYSMENGVRSVVQALRQNIQKTLMVHWNSTQTFSDAIKIRIDFEIRNQVPTFFIQDPLTKKITAEVTIPVSPQFMDLKDDRFLKKLESLESNMKLEIQGQNDLVEKMASFTRLRALRAKDPRPMVFGIFGLTGTGKTEIAKVYAKYFYGSSDRAKIFEFGKIQNRYDLANFFNPAKGVMGSDKPSPFEELLVSFPEGGVIVFDEISNMGKSVNSPSEREALFQYFYSLLDEGKWTSEHGKVYDLSRWTIVMTGNDGQELFRNAFNDDTREHYWQYYNRRDIIKQILMSQGVPEAFVNRIAVLALSRPLTSEVRRPIQDKFLSQHVYSWIKDHGIELILDEEFKRDAARFFFPLEDGARGNRRFIEDDLASFLGDLISAQLAEIQEAKQSGKKITITVRFNHSIPDKVWDVDSATLSQKHLTHIELQAEISGLPRGSALMSRLVQTPTGIRLIPHDQAVLTAIHEAGHALVNEHLNQPAGPLRLITIESAGNYGGYCSFDSQNRSYAQYRGDLESVIREMAAAAAGAISQEVHGISSSRDMGWRGDLDAMRKSLRETLLKNGLIPGLEFASISEKELEFLDEETKQRVAQEVQRLGDISIELARKVLSQPEVRQQVQNLAQSLLEMQDRGYLIASEYQQMIGEYRIPGDLRDHWVAELLQSGSTKAGSRSCAQLLDNP